MPPGMAVQGEYNSVQQHWQPEGVEKKKSNRLVRDDLTWALVYGQRKMDFYLTNCSHMYRQELEYYWQEVNTYFSQHLTDDLFKL